MKKPKPARHTPGPWTYDKHSGRITTADGTTMIGATSISRDHAANGTLIAAAPELAEALEAFVDGKARGDREMTARVTQARAALKKAGRTGGSGKR